MVTATCLLLGAGAIALLPAVASADWAEASRPCNVAEWAIIPAPETLFQVGEAAVPPRGYFTFGLGAGNFTAVANWGDGTTSPATIERLSIGECDGVSAPGHTYAN